MTNRSRVVFLVSTVVFASILLGCLGKANLHSAPAGLPSPDAYLIKEPSLDLAEAQRWVTFAIVTLHDLSRFPPGTRLVGIFVHGMVVQLVY